MLEESGQSTGRSRDKDFKPSVDRNGSGENKSDRLGCTSSLSSWTAFSKLPKNGKDAQKRRVKPSAERRLSDGFKFEPNSKVSVVSSNSNSTSWSTRRDKKPLTRPTGPPKRAPSEPDPPERGVGKMQQHHSIGGKLRTRASRSFGSYSSWATNERTELSKGASREDHKPSRKIMQDEDVLFIGGPLVDQNPPADGLSPVSTSSDSTPFEDILNRCKFKLEQLSTDEESRMSLPGRRLMSTTSGSQSDVIDLVSRE